MHYEIRLKFNNSDEFPFYYTGRLWSGKKEDACLYCHLSDAIGAVENARGVIGAKYIVKVTKKGARKVWPLSPLEILARI